MIQGRLLGVIFLTIYDMLPISLGTSMNLHSNSCFLFPHSGYLCPQNLSQSPYSAYNLVMVTHFMSITDLC